MIDHQLMGPTIASHLKGLTLHPKPLYSHGRHVFLEIDLCDMISRVTQIVINI